MQYPPKTIKIFSIGEYNSQPISTLNCCKIIRIHNSSLLNWFEDSKNIKNFYFDDIDFNQLSFFQRVLVFFKIQKYPLFSFAIAQQIIDFINQNSNENFIIHCEYGKKRSVAIAKFISNKYKHQILNKTTQQLETYNHLVLHVLNKSYQSFN